MRHAKCTRIGTVTVRAVTAIGIALAAASHAGAETTQCTAITSLPYTISAPGTYCLTGDLTTSISSGTAITIAANSVTLDLNGHKLAGNAGGATAAYGVYGEHRRYVVIKNGVIRGFAVAAALAGDNVASVFQDLTTDRNWFGGLLVECTGCVVRHNVVVNTGGTTGFPSSNGIGIYSWGTGNSILENEITSVAKTGSGIAYGIYVDSANTFVEGNRIAGAEVGVFTNATTGNVLVSDNRFTNMPTAMQYTGTGKYRDNLTAGVTALAIGGTDAGGND